MARLGALEVESRAIRDERPLWPHFSLGVTPIPPLALAPPFRGSGLCFLDSPPPPFGSADYSREELIAEMGAAFLCAEARIGSATIANSAAYLAGWLTVLKQDTRAVVFAAAAARKAADRILGTSSTVEG